MINVTNEVLRSEVAALRAQLDDAASILRRINIDHWEQGLFVDVRAFLASLDKAGGQ